MPDATQWMEEFPTILDRFHAWYECEIVDRPLCSVLVIGQPEDGEEVLSNPATREQWMDVDRALTRYEQSLQHTQFFGDAFPVFWPNVGPDLCATAFGCELEFGEITSWSTPIVSDIKSVCDIEPSLENVYFQTIHQLIEKSIERGRDRWITALPDLHTNADLLVALRGSEELCFDLIDEPDDVLAALHHVTDHYAAMFDRFWKPIEAADQPSISMGATYRGRQYVTSCDFLALMSPGMFEPTMAPILDRELSTLERSHFHLDGPDALRHLSGLLSLEGLSGIQWVYGAGNGPASNWIEVYQQVQAAGKCIEVIPQDVEDAMKIIDTLKPEGVWLNGVVAKDVDEANRLMNAVTAWH